MMEKSECEEERKFIRKNYSQKGIKNDRSFQLGSDEHCYRPFESALVKRDEFTIDKDRIIFTRVFRRLFHKAQIYSFTKGDHFRNRLTHSLEVAQIAKSIASNLGLNEELTEAIALGHDIGHTPFGHAGERVLNEIMSGKDDLDGTLKYKLNYGGFKHNFQSLKTLDILERKFETKKGLNLTWQVKEGILKHTEICKCGEFWDLSRFMQSNNEILTELSDKNFSCTLEGQIVAIADEIAQRQHDLDDSLRDKENNTNYGEIAKEICSCVTNILKSSKDIDKTLKSFLINLKTRLSSRNYETKKEEEVELKICRRDALIRDIIEFFILDVTYNSFKNIIKDDKSSIKHFKHIIYVDKHLIEFSESAQCLNDYIENYIHGKVHDSKDVKLSDKKGRSIIRKLFKKYYNDPNLLTNYGKFRLKKRLNHNYDTFYHLKFKDSTGIDDDFEEEYFEKRLLNVLQLNDLNELKTRNDWKLNLSSDKLLLLFKEVNNKSENEIIEEKEKFIKCLLEDHYVYLSVICDHIAGMTDNYAKVHILND